MKAARQNKTINSAFRDLKVISADERERQIYHARMKRQWDIQTREYASKLEGEQIGMQKRDEQIARNMKSMGIDTNTISKATGLFIDNILRL